MIELIKKIQELHQENKAAKKAGEDAPYSDIVTRARLLVAADKYGEKNPAAYADKQQTEIDGMVHNQYKNYSHDDSGYEDIFNKFLRPFATWDATSGVIKSLKQQNLEESKSTF